MKAKYVAAVLSLFIVTLPVHADTAPKPPPVAKTTMIAHKIDLNTADLSMLIGSVKGIGKKRAEAIIAYRDSHQGFKSIDDLAHVKGIGLRFVKAKHDKLNEVFVVKLAK
ncbi:MAG: helix-hairpin-helix domain-containing protein [Legionella sp.]|uniref:ComEA family DNA-binding protein n=1 Tax=Legionella sp. TaxID=459 RepID=UPI0039E3BE6C